MSNDLDQSQWAPEPAGDASTHGVKHRHGCVTAWLLLCAGLLTLTCALFAVITVVHHGKRAAEPAAELSVHDGPIYLAYYTVDVILSVAAIVGLWRMKLWAFYLGVAITALAMVVDFLLSPVDPFGLMVLLIRPAVCGVLILLLQMGHPSTWEQME